MVSSIHFSLVTVQPVVAQLETIPLVSFAVIPDELPVTCVMLLGTQVEEAEPAAEPFTQLIVPDMVIV